MKQYYLSPVVGTGTLADPYRALAANYTPLSQAAIIPTGVDGRPRLAWTLAIVGRTDQQPLWADARLGPLPAVPLATLVANISAQDMATAQTSLIQFGLPATLLVNVNQSWADVLRAIGQRLELTFNEYAFNCADA